MTGQESPAQPADADRYAPAVRTHDADPLLPQHDGAHRSFIPAARVVALLTAVSRFAGLARDAICSRIFGAGPIWSAFALAFLLPNLFRRLFGEGALSAALLPEYTAQLRSDPTLAQRLASAMLALTVVALSVFTVVGELLLLALLLFTPLGESGALALRLAMIMLPYLVFICATGVTGALLQSHNRFAPTSAAPILLNGCIIVVATIWAWELGASMEQTAFAVAWSVLLAGVLQFAWSMLALRRFVRWRWVYDGVRAPVWRVIRNMLPVAIGLAALQINTMLDGLIAGWPVLFGPTIDLPWTAAPIDYPLDESSNAVLYYAQRLYLFPLGVFGLALATAAFPALARAAASPGAFAETLRRGVRLALYIGFPASVGVIAVRADLVTVIFRGGAFASADAARVSTTLLGYAPAIFAYTLTHTLTRGFYALGDTKTPMRAGLLCVICNLPLNLVLIWPLREAGLAWSTSCCAFLQAGILSVALVRRSPGAIDRETVRAVAVSLLCAFIMGAGLFALARMRSGDDAWLPSLLWLCATVALGAGAFVAASLAARLPEPRWLFHR